MQISTQISTQIILNQGELTEAIIEYIKARTDLPADSKFAVEFEDDVNSDLTAVVSITGSSAATGAPVVTPKAAAKPARAPKPAVVAAPAVNANVVATVEEQPNITANPEDRKDPNDPPFEVDPTTESEVVNTAEAKPAETPTGLGTSAATKIFPDANTSAPTPPAVEEPDPKVKAKSLFANLAKPTN